MQGSDAATQAQRDFQNALKRAFWRSVRHRLLGRCNDLLPFDQVFKHLKQRPRKRLGIQIVPLDRIIGSAGRAAEFDLVYYPRRRSSQERWVKVATARYKKGQLPPVLLYKVREVYFVEDGNHRVSVARVMGERLIRAHVIEIDASPRTPVPSSKEGTLNDT